MIAYLAGLPPVRLHDLRHGAATLLLAAGHDMKVVQATLGLSSITIAGDTYRPCVAGRCKTRSQRRRYQRILHPLVPRPVARRIPTPTEPRTAPAVTADSVRGAQCRLPAFITFRNGTGGR